MREIITIHNLKMGNHLMGLCSLCYLICWLFMFRPKSMLPILNMNTYFIKIISGLSLFLTFITGIAGLLYSLKGLVSEHNLINKGIPFKIVIISFIITYFVLLILSWIYFKRFPTIELVLITGYFLLETSIIDYLHMINILDIKRIIILSILLSIIFIINFLCYLKYFNLPERQAYYTGCVPLILCGIASLIINLVISM